MNSSTFTNGPAGGVQLQLARAPQFLRAVRAIDGRWNALDQVSDEPRPGETVHAYVRVGEPLSGHITFSGSGGRRSSAFVTARYALVDPQPPDAVLRDTAAWQAWCRVQAAASPPTSGPATAVEALTAVAEQYGLPDVAGYGKGRRSTSRPTDDGQGSLFGGRK